MRSSSPLRLGLRTWSMASNVRSAVWQSWHLMHTFMSAVYVCTLRSTLRARISSTRPSARLSARWLCWPPPCSTSRRVLGY